jgi:hypothetical protein
MLINYGHNILQTGKNMQKIKRVKVEEANLAATCQYSPYSTLLHFLFHEFRKCETIHGSHAILIALANFHPKI